MALKITLKTGERMIIGGAVVTNGSVSACDLIIAWGFLSIWLMRLQTQTPLGRMGTPDDIAHAAVYLASDEAAFVTGQVLSPNGGWTMNQ